MQGFEELLNNNLFLELLIRAKGIDVYLRT